MHFLICLLLINWFFCLKKYAYRIFFAQLQRIVYPSENEGTASTSRSIQRIGIRGTIWSICFISQDSRQPSKEHNPVLAVIINRYNDTCVAHCQEFILSFEYSSIMEVSFCFCCLCLSRCIITKTMHFFPTGGERF